MKLCELSIYSKFNVVPFYKMKIGTKVYFPKYDAKMKNIIGTLEKTGEVLEFISNNKVLISNASIDDTSSAMYHITGCMFLDRFDK